MLIFSCTAKRIAQTKKLNQGSFIRVEKLELQFARVLKKNQLTADCTNVILLGGNSIKAQNYPAQKVQLLNDD